MMNVLNKKFRIKAFILFALLIIAVQTINAQQYLLLSDAIKTGLQNYQSIKAKQDYIKSSQALVKNTRNEYLPNVLAGIQQAFGTVNSQFGPLSGYGAAGVSSSGPVFANQSWNAAFGAIYLVNTNWEVYSFGRLTSEIKLSQAQVTKDSADLVQEEFIQSVKISGAYLNLLIAQRLIENADSNLIRAEAVQQSVLARTKSGLNAGVDSSIANADVSSARLTLITANDNAQQVSNQLIQLLDADASGNYLLDTTFFKTIPTQTNTTVDVANNPQVKFYQTRIDQSRQATSYLKKSILPGVNLFGIYQTRASGFDDNYAPSVAGAYTENYFDGINPTRSNYALGFSLSWNILSIKKVKEQTNAQNFLTQAYQNEYDLISTQLKDESVLADQRIMNSMQSYREVPTELKAASDAYLQKSVLYKNGLTTIVDLQQAMYALNKAETDASIAYINVWQALLLKAAATGDFNLFLNQIR